MDKLNEAISELGDEFLDLPEFIRATAKEHGRSMVRLAMQAGLAQEAAAKLARVVRPQGEEGKALMLLAGAFNELAAMVVKDHGWTGEMLAKCEQDILLAHSTHIVVPKGEVILTQ